MAIEISPYPDGKDFAFSIIDDTDMAIGPDIEPVYNLLFDLGFRATKTVWVFPPKRSNCFRIECEKKAKDSNAATLADKNYTDFVRGLQKKGFEIALHGVSEGNDYREEIQKGYEIFKNTFGHYPNIDTLHSKNIENLYSGCHKLDNPLFRIVERLLQNSDYQGHVKGSRYFWGDICKEKVKYVRLPFHNIRQLNLLKVCKTLVFHDPRRPYVNYWFPSCAGSTYMKFMNLTRPSNIEKLLKDRGTAIIYTHFAKGFSYVKDNKFRVKPDFQERMAYISTLNGWFATVSEILDRFLAIRNVHLMIEGEKVHVVNTGPEDLQDLTLVADSKATILTSPREELANADSRGAVKLVIKNLPRKSVLTFLLQKTDQSLLPSIGTKSSQIGKLQHIKIEIHNYWGQLLDLLGK